MAGIGIQKIERDSADFSAGVRRFFTVLGAGQVEERIQGFIAFHFRGLQGKTQAAIQCCRCAQCTVEQWPVAGDINRFTDRALTLDEKGFGACFGR